MPELVWSTDFADGTSLRGYFTLPGCTFQETVARLITLSGQNPSELSDRDKVSVEFGGTFDGRPFTLYDYKEGRALHIGGKDGLDVNGLIAHLRTALVDVAPTPYEAREYYDARLGHSWGAR